MKVQETVCDRCIKELGPDVRILLHKGMLTEVEPPCDFCRDKEDQEGCCE